MSEICPECNYNCFPGSSKVEKEHTKLGGCLSSFRVSFDINGVQTEFFKKGVCGKDFPSLGGTYIL